MRFTHLSRAPLPLLSSAALKFNSVPPSSRTSTRVYCMAAAPSSAAVRDAALSASSAIDFLSICHRLKTTKRTGWIRKDVKNPESIADHMYRMGLMALIASDIPGVDRNKCIKMAIVHDIAEAIVGDITPLDGISKAEKSKREQAALDHMCKVLGGGSTAKEIADLWTEYEENSSPEAKFVKDLDKVEMILQALEYEDEQGKDLDEFFQSTAGKFQTETGKAWASEIVSRRKKTNLMKERFAKLFLGEDMSVVGNGVSSALALSNAITRLHLFWRMDKAGANVLRREDKVEKIYYVAPVSCN